MKILRWQHLHVLLWFLICGHAAALDTNSVGSELVVRFTAPEGDLLNTPEGAVQALSNALPGSALLLRFASPVRARFLVDDRVSVDVRNTLPANHPKRVLDSFVVLTYVNEAAANAAIQVLSRDANVADIQVPGIGTLQTTPSDPLFPYVSGAIEQNFQWGPRALNVETAWNNVTGQAYVGTVDNGIQIDHPQLVDNYRSHFSSSFIQPPGCHDGVDEAQGCGGLSNVVGHGTSVAGIIAAKTNDGIGPAGICWNCSLMIARSAYEGNAPETQLVNGLNALIMRGAQIINQSFGVAPAPNCASTPTEMYCMALSLAATHDVILVASVGNDKTSMTFPASDAGTIAVGGIQVGGALWDQTIATTNSPARTNASTEIGTNYGSNMAFVAPARDVVSTMYTSKDYNISLRCGTATTFTDNIYIGGPTHTAKGFQGTGMNGHRYGICTGTSMAAPFVSGVAALLRSVSPTTTRLGIKSYMTSTASKASTPDQYWGYGIPNAGYAVQNELPVTGRLTPWFALYNSQNGDYLLTTVPQMALAALLGTILPHPPTGTYYTYSWLGTYTTGYSSFPGVSWTPPPPMTTDNLRPRARLKVFTTYNDAAGQALYPLYRYSYGDANTVRHVYAVGSADQANINPAAWKLDGIEGYVYPPNISQPSGTVKIYRWVNPSTAAYMILPDGDQAFWTSQGFQTDGTGVLGYAYLN